MTDKHLPYGKEVLIARYDRIPDGDGQDVEVYCCAMPARFYTLKVLPARDSVGEPMSGYVISSGSGVGQLMARLAEEISRGMIGFTEGGSDATTS